MSSILVVDDEPTLRRLVGRHLARSGLEVHCAENGFAAWQLLRTKPIDVILSDVRMPIMGGLELLGKTRSHYPNLPVILMSGSNEVRDRAEAIGQGANDFLAKPVRLAEIERAIARALAARSEGAYARAAGQ